MNKNFPGKNAVYVSSPYSKEHSCKKSEKSLGQLSGKSVYGPKTDNTGNTNPNLN